MRPETASPCGGRVTSRGPAGALLPSVLIVALYAVAYGAIACAQDLEPVPEARTPAAAEDQVYSDLVGPPEPLAGPPALLRDVVELAPPPKRPERRRRWRTVVRFYRNRHYSLAWSDDNGPSPDASELLEVVDEAPQDGLKPDSYKVNDIRARLSSPPPLQPEAAVELDVILTQLFVNCGSDLLNGRAQHPGYPPNEVDFVALLESALAEHRSADALRHLAPQHRGYERLKAVLQEYRQLARNGGWPTVPEGPILRPSASGPRAAALRARLLATGDLAATPEQRYGEKSKRSDHTGASFDYKVAEAVRYFQKRYGLPPDGSVGPATLAALNVPVSDRIRQLELNLERWRWLPSQLGNRYIWVNIPSYELRVMESGTESDGTGGRDRTTFKTRAIVGDSEHPTPLLGAALTHLVLNPFWNIPRSIAVKEIIPAAVSDPQYFQKKNIRVLKGSGPDRREIDPRRINWAKASSAHLEYRFRQDPGPKNSLGRIKFVLPNPFGIYVHDTPGRQLFGKRKRQFSHGCIRIERANDLAEYLLRDSPRWHREEIEEALASGKAHFVPLPQSVPVYLTYFTAWVDEDGVLQFRDDMYGEDATLDEALRAPLIAVSVGK